MLQNQAQECHGTQGAGFKLFGLAVLVVKRHPTMLEGQDIFLLYHAQTMGSHLVLSNDGVKTMGSTMGSHLVL